MGCRKESYFLKFIYVDVARDFVGVVFHVVLDGTKSTKGSHNHLNCCCFEPPHSLNLDLISKSLYLLSFSVVLYGGVGVQGYSHVNEKAGFILLVL